MTNEKLNKQKVIETAVNLFRTNGYHNTTMDDIAKACNIKKPSIYHHIPSREALLISALETCHAQFKESVLSIAHDTKLALGDRMTRFTHACESFFLETHSRCLIGNLVQELSGRMPLFEERAKAFFDDWTTAVSTFLTEKYDKDRAKEEAIDIIAQIQGSLILGLLSNEHAPLKRATQRLNQLL